MAKKRSVSTSRADREDDRRRRNAPRRAQSRFDRVEENRLMGPAPRKFMQDRMPSRSRSSNVGRKVMDKSVEAVTYPILWATNYDRFRSEDSRDRKFDKNKTRTSKLRRTSTRFGSSPDLSRAAGGQPTQRQKRLTAARAEKNRQMSAARSAGRKKASVTKRRER